MLDNDIVGSSTADDGSTDPFNIRMFVQGIPPTWDRRFVAEVASNEITNMTVQPVWRPDRFGRGGDHQSFLSAGFPAVRFTEPHENFAHQHQDVRVVNGVQFGDPPEFCDFEFNALVAKVNGVALWSMAQAPGTPKNVVQSTIQSNNATLSWTVDPNTASYEIVSRASEVPQWTNVVPVGKVGTATVQLAHDNAQFAVRAVGANGFKSPAGFPFSG
ncbi:hypothetical protein K435DRAFT_868695 [Dendrothele bispora CBS 962.96]|uniref:Fibronectin type-III domain-containing protein n=1 Tax=Dendrothele bispora (strain CBS 962.96) TaxID=1314807 RepID=A0A4S8LCG5_DENBC|nr:hypothetical protein K435DRAFT_868695 [Dendrothele bispora CBS 962.96]